MAGERYTLELRALPGEVPVVVRLRNALKALLRQHGFRCTSCVEVKVSDRALATEAAQDAIVDAVLDDAAKDDPVGDVVPHRLRRPVLCGGDDEKVRRERRALAERLGDPRQAREG